MDPQKLIKQIIIIKSNNKDKLINSSSNKKLFILKAILLETITIILDSNLINILLGFHSLLINKVFPINNDSVHCLYFLY